MRLLKLLVMISVCLCLSFAAIAHPGKTDSNGGHIDHSTGQYHYHHGYPAHQHSDMDGDGYLDCPYLFDDQTGSSGNKTDVPSEKVESEKKTASKTKATDYVTIFCCVVVLLGFAKGCVEFAVAEIKQRTKK
jgi:hypothetical protein